MVRGCITQKLGDRITSKWVYIEITIYCGPQYLSMATLTIIFPKYVGKIHLNLMKICPNDLGTLFLCDIHIRFTDDNVENKIKM